MNNIIKSILCLSVIAFASCNDWTEVESITINNPSIEDSLDEGVYDKYLQNLRSYKQREHIIAYGYFDNSSEYPLNPSDKLDNLPDSLDYVSMKKSNLSLLQKEEMLDVRNKKGTKFLSSIVYSDILNEYNLASSENEQENLDANDGFIEFLTQKVNETLENSKSNEFDGLSIWYNPVSLEHLDEATLAIEKTRQETFIGLINQWIIENKDKIFIYEGNPEFLIDKSLLETAKYIVIHGESLSSVYDYSASVKSVLVDGVPNNKFVLTVSTYSLDSSDKKTGYVLNEDGENVSAIYELAQWCLKNETGIEKCGMGIYNIKNDYFNPDIIYQNVRKAISVLNPSPYGGK